MINDPDTMALCRIFAAAKRTKGPNHAPEADRWERGAYVDTPYCKAAVAQFRAEIIMMVKEWEANRGKTFNTGSISVSHPRKSDAA